MNRNELYTILQRCGRETTAIHTLDKIWAQAFDGVTEKINTTKSASSTSPATEDSSATLSESFPDGTTYTRSYQVFLPNPNQPKP